MIVLLRLSFVQVLRVETMSDNVDLPSIALTVTLECWWWPATSGHPRLGQASHGSSFRPEVVLLSPESSVRPYLEPVLRWCNRFTLRTTHHTPGILLTVNVMQS